MTGWILSPIRRWWGRCLLPHVYERGGFYARGEFIRPARSVELRWKGKVLRENGTKDVGYWCSLELIRCRTRLSTCLKVVHNVSVVKSGAGTETIPARHV